MGYGGGWMEWTYPLAGGQGTLVVRQVGEELQACAQMADDGLGLYKCWLTGRGGAEFQLGAFLPEGGKLVLRRTLRRAALERQGLWPPEGANVRRTFTFDSTPPPKKPQGPPGFVRADPQEILGDRVLRESGRDLPVLWSKKVGQETLLAVPYQPTKPFPMVPAFCLMAVVEAAGTRWLCLRLDERGWPVLPPPEQLD